MKLFSLVDKDKITDDRELKQRFQEEYSNALFHPTVNYLYNFILTTLVQIKINQDKEMGLYQKLMMAKVLEEKKLINEYYEILQQLEKESNELHNYNLLLTIQRMELNHLRTNDFKDISEQKLLRKQNRANESLKILRQINEQSSLYELLLLRMQKTDSKLSEAHQQFFTDLIVSEISLVSSLNKDVFEIQKLHQLFQAHYLIYVGDYKSALNSFIELDELFNNNKQQWNSPPMYYVRVLEGVLESLNGIKAYDKMQYFLEKLKLLDYPSVSFQTEIACIRFVYTVTPHLNDKQYTKCLKVIEQFEEELISKKDILTPYRYLQLSLYLSIIYFHNKDLSKARRSITRIINSNSYVDLSLFRPIQIINLIIHYELGNIDIITSRIRSIKRSNKLKKTNSNLENILFHFLGVNLISKTSVKNEKLRERIHKEFIDIESDNEYKRIFSYFDLKSWMLKHIDKRWI